MQNENPDKKLVFKGKVAQKVAQKIDIKRLLFRVFDDPRPEYIAKVTFTDRIIDSLFLWAFPSWVRPNYVTVFRFVSIPFILWLLNTGQYETATVLFVISAFSDALDGAIARTRKKITDWGIVFDPITDKLLIGIVGGTVIFEFLSPRIAIAIISIELLLIASAYYRFKGKVVPAKTIGKIKMVLESVGVGFIFLFLMTGSQFSLLMATYTLYTAIFFAVLSLIVYRSI